MVVMSMNNEDIAEWSMYAGLCCSHLTKGINYSCHFFPTYLHMASTHLNPSQKDAHMGNTHKREPSSCVEGSGGD